MEHLEWIISAAGTVLAFIITLTTMIIKYAKSSRGCDIVFFDKKKFQHFYPLLQTYFLDYDLALMEQRWNNCKETK